MVDIETTYKEFGPMVYRRCLQLLGDEAQAAEAMQDVFVKLMGVEEVSAPSSLLYIMATRHCLNILRSKKRRPEDPSGDLVYEIASARDFEETSKARMLLAQLFGRTPESSRVIAVLHYLDGLTLEEVAKEVGMSVSGVRKRLRVLRQELTILEGQQ